MPLLEMTRAAAPAGDPQSETADFYAEVMAGLTTPVKTLPCKYFYDERGSQLFDEICELDEYYPTRTEAAIMERHAEEMAALLGPDCRLVEYGSGSSTKTQILLDKRATDLAAYVPVDISRVHLLKTAEGLRRRYSQLEILPVCADYTAPFALPEPSKPAARTVAYFPGSTIGNFHPRQAQLFLTQIAKLCGEGGGLLIGVDLKKDPGVLHAAYNDAKGVTAAFNLNVLDRINQELRGRVRAGRLRASRLLQRGARPDRDAPGQPKGPDGRDLRKRRDRSRPARRSIPSAPTSTAARTSPSWLRSAGFEVNHFWTDPNELFSVQYLTVAR